MNEEEASAEEDSDYEEEDEGIEIVEDDGELSDVEATDDEFDFTNEEEEEL
jgi:hypothetical protein